MGDVCVWCVLDGKCLRLSRSEDHCVGKELKVVGRAPSSPETTFSYRVDGGDRVEVSFASSSPSASPTDATPTELGPFTYREWASVTLPSDNELHRVFFAGLPIGTSIDYAVLSVHDSASLSEEDTAVVDDGDGSLEWKGAWSEIRGGDLGDEVAAFGGGVHATREVGSEVKIRFVGKCVTLRIFSLVIRLEQEPRSLCTPCYRPLRSARRSLWITELPRHGATVRSLPAQMMRSPSYRTTSCTPPLASRQPSTL